MKLRIKEAFGNAAPFDLWSGAPDLRYLTEERVPPPALQLEEVFGSRWAEWIQGLPRRRQRRLTT